MLNFLCSPVLRGLSAIQVTQQYHSESLNILLSQERSTEEAKNLPSEELKKFFFPLFQPEDLEMLDSLLVTSNESLQSFVSNLKIWITTPMVKFNFFIFRLL